MKLFGRGRDAQDPVRIGYIGLGLRANLADAAHHLVPGVTVTAVCDLSPPALEYWSKRFGARVATDDYREVLSSDEVDAVIIATPDNTHAELAVAALRAGKPAYVEKPLGITVEECDAILSAAYETGTKLYVGHNMRHMPVVTTMRELILGGTIGAVQAVWCRHFVGHGGDFYFKDWHADRRNTTGLLLQKGAHDIDVIHWLAGGYTTRTNAFGRLAVYGRVDERWDDPETKPDDWFDPGANWPPLAQRGLHPVVDIEDLSMMQMVLDNGVLASYEQCHFTPDYWRNYTVIGDAGRLENFGDTDSAVVKVWNSGRSGYRADADLTVDVPIGEGGHGGADPKIVAEFCRFVREGGLTDTNPIAARMSVAAGVCATRSLRSGGVPIDVPALPVDLERYFEQGQPTRGA